VARVWHLGRCSSAAMAMTHPCEIRIVDIVVVGAGSFAARARWTAIDWRVALTRTRSGFRRRRAPSVALQSSSRIAGRRAFGSICSARRQDDSGMIIKNADGPGRFFYSVRIRSEPADFLEGQGGRRHDRLLANMRGGGGAAGRKIRGALGPRSAGLNGRRLGDIRQS